MQRRLQNSIFTYLGNSEIFGGGETVGARICGLWLGLFPTLKELSIVDLFLGVEEGDQLLKIKFLRIAFAGRCYLRFLFLQDLLDLQNWVLSHFLG